MTEAAGELIPLGSQVLKQGGRGDFDRLARLLRCLGRRGALSVFDSRTGEEVLVRNAEYRRGRFRLNISPTARVLSRASVPVPRYELREKSVKRMLQEAQDRLADLFRRFDEKDRAALNALFASAYR